MVAGALCEFIAVESSTYERWLRFESSEKKDCPSVNDQFSIHTNLYRHKFLFCSKLVALSLSLSLSLNFFIHFLSYDCDIKSPGNCCAILLQQFVVFTICIIFIGLFT